MQITSSDVLTGLAIVAAVMVIIVLYHALFIVVDLRKILRRVEDITRQVESVILKPIAMADQIMEWVIVQIEGLGKREKKHKHIDESTKH